MRFYSSFEACEGSFALSFRPKHLPFTLKRINSKHPYFTIKTRSATISSSPCNKSLRTRMAHSMAFSIVISTMHTNEKNSIIFGRVHLCLGISVHFIQTLVFFSECNEAMSCMQWFVWKHLTFSSTVLLHFSKISHTQALINSSK